MIIDVHAHIKVDNKVTAEPKDLIQSMDKAGIDFSCIIADNITEYDEGISTEKVIEISEKFPRLKAIGNVDYTRLDGKQLQFLTNKLKEKKIVGIKLYPGYQNFYPYDERLYTLFAYCQKEGKPIIVHTGMLEIGYRGELKQVHPLHIDTLANAFPQLRIIIAHIGNPWIMDTAAVLYKNPYVYADFSGLSIEYAPIRKEDMEYMQKQIMEIRNFVGDVKKCLFGTDWPLYDQGDYLHTLQQLPITEEEKEYVFWRNAKELFQIDEV